MLKDPIDLQELTLLIGAHLTFAKVCVIPTEVGIHLGARSHSGFPSPASAGTGCTGMTGQPTGKVRNLQIRDALPDCGTISSRFRVPISS